MKVAHAHHIAAPPELVWSVAIDIDNWPNWTPTVDRAKRLDGGQFRLGSQAVLNQPGLPEITWTVTLFEDGERFVWESTLRGIPVAATHEVIPSDNGCTSQLYFETLGLIGALLGPFLRRPIQEAIERENNGLKVHCEALAQPSASSHTE